MALKPLFYNVCDYTTNTITMSRTRIFFFVNSMLFLPNNSKTLILQRFSKQLYPPLVKT